MNVNRKLQLNCTAEKAWMRYINHKLFRFQKERTYKL